MTQLLAAESKPQKTGENDMYKQTALTLLVAIGLLFVHGELLAQETKPRASGSHSTHQADNEPDLQAQLAELRAALAKLEAALEMDHNGTSETMAMSDSSMGMGMKMMRMGMDMMGHGMKSGGMSMGMMKKKSDGGMKMGMGMMSGGGMKMGGMHKKGSMGMGMMGDMGASADTTVHEVSALPGFPGASHIYHIGATGFFTDHAKHLALSDEQQRKLNDEREAETLRQSTMERQLEELEQELWVLTSADQPDAKQVEAKIRAIEKLRGDKRLSFIRAVGRAAKALTEEQVELLKGEPSSETQHKH